MTKNPNKIIRKNNYALIEIQSKDGSFKCYSKIDVSDIAAVKKYRWNCSQVYVKSFIEGKYVLLHNFLMGKIGVDHINNDPLDNRRKNLRIANMSQQNMNKGLQRNNKTGVRGVYLRKRFVNNKEYKYFVAEITVDKKRIPLGYFKDLEAAKERRKLAEKKHFKEYRYEAL